MAVSTSYSPTTVSWTLTNQAIPIAWQFFASTDLVVTEISSTGVETVKSLTTHYTVSGGTDANGLPAIGTVTMVGSATSGSSIRVIRRTAKTQSISFTAGGAFPAKSVEAMGDRGILIAQEEAGGGGSVNDEITGDVLQLNSSGATDYWDAEDHIIRNVANGTEDDDAINKSQLDAATMGDIYFTQSGTGATTRTWLTKLREVEVSVLDFGADNTGSTSASAAIQLALDAVNARGGGTVRVPPGTYLLTSTLTLYKKCSLIGEGFGRTIFSRTANYGNTLQVGVNTVGNTAQDCEVAGIWFYHPHTYVAGTTTTLDNAVSAGTKHAIVYDGQDVRIHDNWFTYLPYGIVIDGGLKVSIDRNYFLTIYDHITAGLQEGVASIYVIRGTLSSTIPTQIDIHHNFLSGQNSVARSVSWGTGSVTHAENIGAQYGILIECIESASITSNYIGANNIAGIRFNPAVIASDVHIIGNQLDGCRLAQIQFDYNGASASDITVAGNTLKGASVSAKGILANVTGANPSVRSLAVNGNHFNMHVKTPMHMLGCIGGVISGNTFTGYNARALTYADPEYAAGIMLVGSGSSGVAAHFTVGPNRFGGSAYAAAGSADNNAQWGVFTSGTGTTSNINLVGNAGLMRTGGTLLGGDLLSQVGALVDDSGNIIAPATIELGHATDTTVSRASAGRIAVEGSNVLMASDIGASVQAYDADLGAVAGLASSGLVARTGSGTAAVRTITGPAAGITVSNGDGVSGNPTLALANDIAALEGLSSTGLAVRTTTDTWAQRSIAAGTGIAVSNGDGVSGNPTVAISDAELLALAGLTSAVNKVPYFTGSGAAALADFSPDSWTSWSPTVTSQTGTITTVGTTTAAYCKIGKIVFFTISVAITTNGTGATAVKVTLPGGIDAESNKFAWSGREQTVGAMLYVYMLDTSSVYIQKYDSTYPAIDGSVLTVAGFYKTA